MRTVGACLASALTLTAGLAAQQSPAPRTGLIVGQVVDAVSGKPMSGAIVTIGGLAPAARLDGQPPPQPPRILTGSDGRFIFRDLPRGSFNITATKGGHAEGAYGRRRPEGPSQQVTLGEGERVGDVIVRLWKFGAITGTVVDEAGEPLVTAQVRAFRRSVATGRTRFVGASNGVTDDRGMYRLGNLIPGEYVVVSSSRQVAVPLAIAQESQGRGTVAGSAIFEMGGTTSLPGTSMALEVGTTVYPVGRGAVIPPPAAGGRLSIYAPTFHQSADALAQAITIMLAAGEERSAIDIQLHPVPTVRVSGSVIGSDGPAKVTPMRLRPAGSDDIALDQDWPATVTDQNGAFTFPAVPAGEYSLRMATRGLPVVNVEQRGDLTQWAEMSLTVGRADIEGVILTLQRGLRISGRVEFDGVLAVPSAVRLVQVPIVIEPGDSMADAVARTPPPTIDGSGNFTSVGLPAGRYFVRVAGSPVGWMFRSAMHNGRDLSMTPLELRDGDVTGVVITFTDRWTGLRGVARSAKGPGDEDATVLVFPTDTRAWTDFGSSPRRVRSAHTRKGGEYSFTSLPPGDYYAVALPDPQAADWQDPKFLEAVARIATRVTIGDGEQRTQDLRTREMR